MKNRKHLDIIQISAHYPPDIGGLEVVMEKLVKHQLLTHENVKVATGKNKNINYPEIDNVYRFNRLEIIRNVYIIPKLFSFLLKTNNKIYYVHYGMPSIPEIVFFISKLKLRNFVIHIHLELSGSTPFRKFMFKIYNRTIVRFMYKRSDVIIVPTESYRLYISYKYGINRDKIYSTIPGIDFENFSQVDKQIHKEFNILFVGKLKIQKNLPLLINAFDVLANKYEDIYLYIVGNGPEEDNIKKLTSKKKNRNRISFHGSVSHKELPESYKNKDLFVLPSLTESAGLVILEAFAAKVPVVATKCLGVIDLIGRDRGILVKNNDVEALVKGIEMVYLNNLNIKEMVSNAYNFAKRQTWRQMTLKINRILRKLE